MDYGSVVHSLANRGYAVLYLPCIPAGSSSASARVADDLASLLRRIRNTGYSLLDTSGWSDDIWRATHKDLDRCSGFASIRAGRVNFVYRALALSDISDKTELHVLAPPPHSKADIDVKTAELAPLEHSDYAHEVVASVSASSVLHPLRDDMQLAWGKLVDLGAAVLHHYGRTLMGDEKLRKQLDLPLSSARYLDLLPLLCERTDCGGVSEMDGTASSIALQFYDSRNISSEHLCGEMRSDSAEPVLVKVDPHVDCTMLTLVCPGNNDGCLSIYDAAEGGWVNPLQCSWCSPPAWVTADMDVEPVVIMTGFLLHRAMGHGRYPAYSSSTMHQVIVRPNTARTSIVLRLLPRREACLDLETVAAALRGVDAKSTATKINAATEVKVFRAMCDSVNAAPGTTGYAVSEPAVEVIDMEEWLATQRNGTAS